MKKGIYLCSRLHRLLGYDIIYNDIEKRFKPDLLCSCEDVDLSKFDYVIATPPCNYYSRANYRRESSPVALATKHLLPTCLEKCVKAGIPFIVENVNNESLLPRDYDAYCYRFNFGGHTFWTNIWFSVDDLVPVKQNKQNVCRQKRDGNINVDLVIRRFLREIHGTSYLMLNVFNYSANRCFNT